jgi:hypothetical protein
MLGVILFFACTRRLRVNGAVLPQCNKGHFAWRGEGWERKNRFTYSR